MPYAVRADNQIKSNESKVFDASAPFVYNSPEYYVFANDGVMCKDKCSIQYLFSQLLRGQCQSVGRWQRLLWPIGDC